MNKSNIIVETNNLNLWYGKKQALKDINIEIQKNKVTALIGPSGCGKSTLLRCFNRLNDLIPECVISGEVLYKGENIYGPNVDIVKIRKENGMVFQKPNPFPKSIWDNIAYGPQTHMIKDKEKLNEITESPKMNSELLHISSVRLRFK